MHYYHISFLASLVTFTNAPFCNSSLDNSYALDLHDIMRGTSPNYRIDEDINKNRMMKYVNMKLRYLFCCSHQDLQILAYASTLHVHNNCRNIR